MALYKLEDNVREKMEARELKPSADAWKRLQEKLEAEQPQRKSFFWYYTAASLVGLLIATSLFFNSDTSKVDPRLVQEDIAQPQVAEPNEGAPQTFPLEEIASGDSTKEPTRPEKRSERKTPSNKPQTLPQSQDPKKSAIGKKMEKSDALAVQTNTVEKQSVKIEKTVLSKEDQIINTKVDEVVPSVKKLKENNSEITVNEVEALLANARREVQIQRILSSKKVDATALLQDVEWELEKSFRDKVFDALGEGFNKIRTAVSERND